MSSGNSPSSNAVPVSITWCLIAKGTFRAELSFMLTTSCLLLLLQGPSRSSPQTQQSSIEALDFGTSWMLPGLSPGQPRESTMATDILDLYDRPSSVTPEPLLKDSVPDVSQQTIPAAGSSTEVQRSESTSPNWTLDRPPRRLPSGPRPLPSSSNSSYRSLGSSSNHIDGHVPEDYHSSWAQRPRPAFRPIASSEQAKQSFESMRSSSDFSERSNSSLAAAATRNRSIRTANEDAHQLRPLQEVESPSQLHPTIIETPPLPVPPKNASAAASPSGDFPSPIGHPQTSPYTTARPSPSSSLTGNQFLQRNTSTGTMISTPMGESDTELHCNQALLSNMATWLKDRVPRAEHVRGAIPYPMSFTGRDIVSTLERALSDAFKSRRIALHVARSLHTQLFFFEIRDNEQPVNDGLDQVFVFPEDDGGGATWDEIPSAVLTEVTGCYSPLCSSLSRQGFITGGCLSPSCPNNHHATVRLSRSTFFPYI